MDLAGASGLQSLPWGELCGTFSSGTVP